MPTTVGDVNLVRFVRLLVGASIVLVLGAGLAGQGVAPTTPSPASVRVPTVGSSTAPTNAAKIFRWGNAQWFDNFVSPLAPMWSVNHAGQVRNQHGMLTLDSTATSGSITATLTGHPRQYGRWEARVRSRQYGTGGTPYHVVWELVPTRDDHCGARGIVLSDYALGSNLATMHVRNIPNLDYRVARSLPLTGNQFHTYAVEVTPDHVSWFVDTRVMMTERRTPARTGALYNARFRLVGVPGTKMNAGRMQMDWVRYYTLAQPNAKPIVAPQATLGTYAGAC